MGTEVGRRGQALIEMAVGMFALSLVLAALFAFADYIVKGLKVQRELRASAGLPALNLPGDVGYVSKVASDTVEVEPFAAEYLFGTSQLKIREKVSLPGMSLIGPVGP